MKFSSVIANIHRVPARAMLEALSDDAVHDRHADRAEIDELTVSIEGRVDTDLGDDVLRAAAAIPDVSEVARLARERGDGLADRSATPRPSWNAYVPRSPSCEWSAISSSARWSCG
jgi:hypothetical protein